MSSRKGNKSGYVKKETLLLAVLAAFAIGFVVGVVYSVFKAGPIGHVHTAPSPPSRQAENQAGNVTTQQAGQMLSLERELKANPDNVAAWIRLGHLYFDSGKYKEAIGAYEKSLALAPNNADVWTDLGVMYRRNGQPEKAVSSFEKAIAINPRHEPSRINKGIVLRYDLNDREGAIKAWEDVLKINPGAKAPNGRLLSEEIKNL